MPRANRFFQPGYIWHITHRCHQRKYLLKFACDRRRWRHWLFEARKRYGLCVLNYIVTSNHVHLLVMDTGKNEIAPSMQLIAGRSGQDYNRRKDRRGAFWEDRYHATAVDSERYLARCLVYIDLNMVRAGVVSHPSQWEDSGYREASETRNRYRIVDQNTLNRLLGLDSRGHLQCRNEWINEALQQDQLKRDEIWTESLAVGREDFVCEFLARRAILVPRSQLQSVEDFFFVRDRESSYSSHFTQENATLTPDNSVNWKQKL